MRLIPPWLRRCRCRSYHRRTGRHVRDCPRSRPGPTLAERIRADHLAHVEEYIR